ncbi:MAG: carbon-nitrogen hydrolase family protein [Candidatus Saccharibacteria bacterium]
MKIALIQMSSRLYDIESNFETMKDFIKESIKLGADIIAFPEMNLTGYFYTPEHLINAIPIDNEYVTKTVGLTKNNDVTLILGIAETVGDKTFVTQIVAEAGKIVGTYRKHNIVNLEAKLFHAGDIEPIFVKADKKYGLTICADIDLSDLFQTYAQKGCNFVIECASPDLYGNRNPRNWEGGYNWWKNNCIEKIGQYAKDNKINILVTTQSGRNEQDDFPGGGYLFSSDGKIISGTTDYKQEILIVTI